MNYNALFLQEKIWYKSFFCSIFFSKPNMGIDYNDIVLDHKNTS